MWEQTAVTTEPVSDITNDQSMPLNCSFPLGCVRQTMIFLCSCDFARLMFPPMLGTVIAEGGASTVCLQSMLN